MSNKNSSSDVIAEALSLIASELVVDKIFQGNADRLKNHLAAAREALSGKNNSALFRRIVVSAEKKQLLDIKKYQKSIECANSVRVLEGQALSSDHEKVILFLGPMKFGTDVWNLRSTYILPDLFSSINESSKIAMLIPEPPESALQGIKSLAKRFSISVYTFSPSGENNLSDWFAAATALVSEVGSVDVITNIQGHTFFGRVIGHLKRRFSFKGVLRVGGDELVSRIELGSYKSPASLCMDYLNEIYAFNNSDRIICMSTWEQARISMLVADGNKIHVVFRGVDFDVFKDVVRNVTHDVSRDGSFRILYLGRRSAEKGWDSVLNLARLADKDGRNFEFIFAGAGFGVGKEKNLEFLGFVQPNKLPELISNVDAVILLSATEGFPQVLMEALAVGRICFVSDSCYKQMLEGMPGVFWLNSNAEESLEQMNLALRSCSSVESRSEIRERAMLLFDKEKCREAYRRTLCEW